MPAPHSHVNGQSSLEFAPSAGDASDPAAGARFRVDGARFRLDQFEGPLDLLLHLIQRAEVNIYDIPIAAITTQYLEYLAAAGAPDPNGESPATAANGTADAAAAPAERLEELTRFQVMAATLLHVKSRMLLPLPYSTDEPYEDPRQELVERLLEYQRFKRLSDILSEQQRTAQWIITRTEPRVPPALEEQADSNGHGTRLSPDELLRYFREIVAAIGSEQLTSLYEEFTVNQKIALVHERLQITRAFAFTELVGSGSALEIICAFWAVLELAKNQTIVVLQRQPFADITVQRRRAVEAV
jgi:segregation and condensation protein A